MTGFAYTGWYIHVKIPALNWQDREGKTLRVAGTVLSIPDISDKRQRFEFKIEAIQINELWDKNFSAKVRLSWYDKKIIVKNAQQWQFEVRLKKPNGSLNPGGFDYEKWLFQHRIQATGYIRNSDFNKLLSEPSTALFSVAQWRQHIAETLDRLLQRYPYKGLVKALSVGLKSDIEQAHWKTFIDTGTNHLMAISGLHIGLMASFTWIIVYWLWRQSISLNRYLPAYYIASFSAFSMACFYAALAGFAIPTQRALIMLGVVFVVTALKRELPVSYVFLYALLIVLLVDPLSSLASGFWLSFGAVAIILFTFSNRLASKSTPIISFLNAVSMQWKIFIGLIPILAILLNKVSIISPLANLIAIPLMSLIIVPVTLLAALISSVYEPLASILFAFLQWPFKVLLDWLQWLNASSLTGTNLENSNNIWHITQSGWISMIFIIMGSLWLILPKGIPGRWLGLLLFLPAIVNTSPRVEPGNVQLSILDVGQGLAVIVRTARHTLLYDTGDKYSEMFNFADQVILPFTRTAAISAFDKVIVSNGDRDHAGSIHEILSGISVKELTSSEIERLDVELDQWSVKKNTCQQGQQWRWDNVSFEYLSPDPLTHYQKSNNRSCVLFIKLNNGQSFLLTGDIEKKAEKQILLKYPQLHVDVLLVPHHGSNTSSSAEFIRQLKPDIAVFSYGYKNRFHFPAKNVLKRYQAMNIKLYNTTNGALDITSNITNNSLSIKQFRLTDGYFWHRSAEHL